MNKNLTLIILCIFIGVGIFSFFKTISLFKDNKALNQQISDVLKPKIAELEKEKTKINDELMKVQNSLLASEEENNILKEELISKKNELEQTQTSLKEKEKTLIETTNKYNELEKESNLLKDKFSAMFAEFIGIKKTLSSADALKKALKDLKVSSKKNKKTIRISKNKRIINKNDNKGKQEHTDEVIAYGNGGYLVRDGKSTYVPKARIRVLTVEE